MKIEILVPRIGESINEVVIGELKKKSGDYVEVDEELLEVESEKATLPVVATKAGRVHYLVEQGDTLKIGDKIAEIEVGAEATTSQQKAVPVASVAPVAPVAVSAVEECAQDCGGCPGSVCTPVFASPAAAKILREKNIDLEKVPLALGSGRKGMITKEDALKMTPNSSSSEVISGRSVERKKMTLLRRTIAKRLLEVKNSTAMLTSFNEVDMSRVVTLRKVFKESFEKKYGVSLGYMSFFAKACAEVLKEIPEINAMIDGEEIVYHHYVDMGIAVSTPRGLVVPVVRDTQILAIPEIEQGISKLAQKAREGKITPDEMKGGTFTITNGGVFGSMLSTPLLNAPQVGILGMHSITDRAVVVEGQVVVRPMMYLALSYDHRLVDGKEAVTFLKRVKEYIENPERLLIAI
ncbi:MAG: 2-oxoglutarate dehydrogenase complex dihydrolipoyllysine-residue succinyltransferase [Oligoflexia bacterium]|nr:2-oxoglutarate dehydrogenase complex dihydrolipoyllysine-residue succinyltransferase [Oligoflexia bacterium]MBF0364727.1 2-oxoglutarate dehydrogenase complex dihydrolipoyllysine-residue succinyltransferase [Oligoflexia bacterium]